MARVSVFLALAVVLGLVASALAGSIVVQSATTVSIDGAAATSGAISYTLNGASSPLTISCATTGAACNYNSGLTITDTTGNAVTVSNTVGFNSISFTAGAGTTFAVSAGATLTSATTTTLSAVSTITGTFISTGIANIGGTSLTVASTGTLTLNGATSTISAASTISGSLTGSATVTFSSTVTDNSVGATLNVGGLVFQNNVNLVAATTVTAGSAGLQISGGSANIAAPITSGGNVAISTTGTNTITLSGNLAITGSLALSGTSSGLYTISGTTVTGSTTFADTHAGALTFSATTATFGTGVTITTTAGTVTISGAIISTAGNILVNPTGAITLTGSLKANAGSASIALIAGAASTITGAASVNSLDAALLQFGPNAGNAFSGTTYTISGANIKFGTSIFFNAPTSFVNSALVTTPWTVTVSGGSAVSGPVSAFTQTVTSNVISSSLFPNGINTNCIQFDADTTVTSFLISLPGAIAYRNLGKYTWGALTVTSTSAGAVTFCAPTITSTMDRRNDVHKNDLVYYGGQVVYFLSFSAALPFGSITATDFSVVGGTISSVSSLSATTWAIVVQITCDGVVNLNYNGSFTGGSVTSTYQSIVTQSSVRVVSAKCIANIYAPCS